MLDQNETSQHLADVISRAKEQITLSDRDAAAERYVLAKRKEEAATNERLEAEAEIIKLFGNKTEGSQTEKSSLFAVTTTGKLTYTIDADALSELSKDIPKKIRDRILRTKIEANLTELRKLAAEEPEMYRTLAGCLTVRPAKTAVKVEILKM